ncbi:protein-disulfide reductase DsbD domain-containing protein [Mucilaginibacter ximonensis]|uniref:Protein-disulfide reductase DsbD domain-containing protein n=1 Tax=Mucilaginibacter ximonensis TaxID=538021 RepID=A0ABW5YB23_9SPHI
MTSYSARAQIQNDPSHWAYGIKKLTGNRYEVHLQCTLDEEWHIYAQKQGPGFIGTATKIIFNKQPGLTLIGRPLEKGKKDTYVVKEVDIKNYEYSGRVDFVQLVSIKPGTKEIKGKVIYQTCTHEHCLPQTSLDFTIPITN